MLMLDGTLRITMGSIRPVYDAEGDILGMALDSKV
jgi:hypothetical protein